MKAHKGKAFSEYWESLSPMNSPLKIPMDNLLLEFLIKNAWSAPFVCAQECNMVGRNYERMKYMEGCSFWWWGWK